MQTSGNTILITGGATGIGLALAHTLLAAGNTVIICGRRTTALAAAQAAAPGLHTHRADLASPADRRALAEWVTTTFPALNILVNNAGIQREFDLLDPAVAARFEDENEIETNLTGLLHLTLLLLPHLRQCPAAAVVNITSGLGYVPVAIMPVYCATKAAVQSFTRSLRQQLRTTAVKVFDIAPPLVATELDRGARTARGQKSRTVAPEKVARETLRALATDRYEVAIMPAAILRVMNRLLPNVIFRALNKTVPRASESATSAARTA